MIFDKNPVMRIGPPTFVWANIFSFEQLQKRYQEGNPGNKQDFLAKFLEIKEKNPELVSDNTVILWLLSNVLAGSDSTAYTMCAAIYYVLKNPDIHKKLCDELRSANLSLPARWKDIQGLKYLEAVMRETMRVHPGVGLILERVVPKGGLSLPDGRFVPEGVTVGMNPWVINKDEGVFGANTDDFIPERWLQSPGESDEVYQARFSKMKGTDFTFGAGSRACLGRYLSQLESFKLIATLFSTFDVSWYCGIDLYFVFVMGFGWLMRCIDGTSESRSSVEGDQLVVRETEGSACSTVRKKRWSCRCLIFV
jgi:cytochrome P450